MTELLLVDQDVPQPAASDLSKPMVVVDDAHVTYQVFAAGKKLGGGDNKLGLKLLRGGRNLQSVPALRGVSFTACEGETIGVVGHNGSGKSTLFRAMSGLIPTSEGAIWARDRPVLLGVNAALVPDLSGENNIKLGLLAMGFSPEEAESHVDEIADFAELNEFIHHPMRTYSSGMGARLRFAIASARAHSILLIDEALAVGDRRFKAKSEERIRELRDNAGLVMIVSHSVGSLKDTCERVLWIHKGELVADGPATEVIDDYVKWTKQPGPAAVGAASGVVPIANRHAPHATSPRKAAAEVVAPKEAATASTDESSGAMPELLHSLSGSTEASRTSARRERHRQAARRRSNRRLVAAGVTGAAVLLAVGAGASLALLSSLPAPVESPAPRVSSSSLPDGPPTIKSFTASTATATCEASEGEVPVRLNWDVENAGALAIAGASVEVDAIDQPIQSSLPTLAYEFIVPFPCSEQSRVYTLTAAGADGARLSATVAVARDLTESNDSGGSVFGGDGSDDSTGGGGNTGGGTDGGNTDGGNTDGGNTDGGNTGGGTDGGNTGGGTDGGNTGGGNTGGEAGGGNTGGGTDGGNTGGGTDGGNTGGGTDGGNTGGGTDGGNTGGGTDGGNTGGGTDGGNTGSPTGDPSGD